MDIDNILVAVFSLAGMAFAYWFFLMKKEEVVSVTDSVDILVKGGYSPNTISIPKGKTTKINFTRRDSSSCLEEVVISDFKIRKFLPMNKTVTIEVTPEKAGEYQFECGMNMFHGKIIVEDPEQSRRIN
ncbi:cupredoxin domain-containing protein [Candidatus Roizmanbacteria bacterium]|nr:cupredoxin domain-containing protein [Candidatus Roizmanbacteria bacterium]